MSANGVTNIRLVWNAECQQWERWPVGTSRRIAHWMAYAPAEWAQRRGRLGRRFASWWLNDGPGQHVLRFLFAKHRGDW